MGVGSGSGKLGCGGTCMKYILFIFNFVFFLSGAAILGVAIWIKVDPDINDYLEIINWDESNELLSVASSILIGVGAFIFLVGFCGCCGACRESTCLLQMYAALMIIVLILEIVAAILAIVFSSELGEDIEKSMAKQVNIHVMGYNEDNPDNDPEKDPLTISWNRLQKDLQCCGGSSFEDYINSRFANNTDNSNFDILVPMTCCKFSDKGKDEPDSYPDCLEDANGGDNDQLYKVGCYEGLIDWMKSNSVILIGIGFGLAVLEILGIIMACCVASGIKEEKGYA